VAAVADARRQSAAVMAQWAKLKARASVVKP